VLVHLRTNRTTRAFTALFGIRQSAVDRVIHYLVPVLARARLHRIPISIAARGSSTAP
jgi:hypothetical protein